MSTIEADVTVETALEHAMAVGYSRIPSFDHKSTTCWASPTPRT